MMQGVVARKTDYTIFSKERKNNIHLCNKADAQVTAVLKKENPASFRENEQQNNFFFLHHTLMVYVIFRTK